MNALEIVLGHCVQHDPSGQGHAWQSVDGDGLSPDTAEELAAWIVEDEPLPGDECIAGNGQHYRLPGK